MNLRRVTTSVTVSDVHSVVSTNTAFIQMYLGNTKENRSTAMVKGRRIKKQQMQDELECYPAVIYPVQNSPYLKTKTQKHTHTKTDK